MAPVSRDPVGEFIAETVAAAPPVSDRLRADLQMIIWGSADAAPAEAA